MILPDKVIRTAIDRGTIGVDPAPDDVQIQPASLDVRLDEAVTLRPMTPEMPLTRERVELPNDVAALMTGRSSVARKKVIVHKTAGWIDPGFRGQIMLEMLNLGDEVVDFDEGARVAQLIFMSLTGESDGYKGQYQNQGADP